jgi:hypothetical protein
MSAKRYGKTDARLDRNCLFIVVEFPPHLAAPLEEKPNLLHRSMGNGHGCLAGRELKMGKTPSFKLKQGADI